MIIAKDFIGIGCWATIINDKNEILLIKRKNNHLWERLGGKLEFGESFEQCLIREIKEETNIVITVSEFSLVEENYDSKNKLHWVCIGYLCKYKSGEPKLLELEKHEELRWFSLKDLPLVTRYTKNAIGKYLNNRQQN